MKRRTAKRLFEAPKPRSRAAFTLVELIVATGLAALILIALVTLVQTSLGVWGRTETRRDLLEQATAISELLAEDLSALEGGQRGDLFVDWIGFDTDNDGINGLYMPRLRLIRRISAPQLSRRGYLRPNSEADEFLPSPVQRTGGLLEVVWVQLPGEIGSLRRGERWLGDQSQAVYFEPGFFDQAGRPLSGATQEVSQSVLWFGPLFASQTSDLRHGWKVGQGLLDCGQAWDARTSERLDEDLCALNLAPAGCPASKALPVFPRRIRFELEIERKKDLGRRTSLAEAIDRDTTHIKVRNELLAPKAGDFMRLDEEWMQVSGVEGRRLRVVRGVRGTRNSEHEPGGLIHFGERTVRELRVSAYRENWNL